MKKSNIDRYSRLNEFAQNGKWQNIVVKFITSDLFWLLIACGVFRLIVHNLFFNTDSFFDSKTYLNYDANILLGQVDVMRTPVYPYFIKLIKLFGEAHLIQNIVWVQSVISFLTIIVFYKTVSIVFKSRLVIVLASFVYGTLPSILNFDQCILTESLSISAMVVFFYFIVSYLKKQTILKAGLLTLYVFFLVMLRPSFIFLLPLLSIFWILRMIFYRKEWKMCLSGLTAIVVSLILIWGYTQLNYINNGYRGIALPSNINQLDIIINAEMYEHGNDPEITETIKMNLSNSHTNYNDSVRSILYAKYSLDRLSDFTENCIRNQPAIYFKRIISKSIELRFSNATTYYAVFREGFISDMFFTVSNTFSKIFTMTFFFLYLLLFFDVIGIVTRWVRLKKIPWFKLMLNAVISGQLAIAIIGAQGEYARLFVPVMPLVIILLFSYLDMIIYAMNKEKLLSYSQ